MPSPYARHIRLVVLGLVLLAGGKALLIVWERNSVEKPAPQRPGLYSEPELALLRYAAAGDVRGVATEIRAGASVNIADDNGETALSLALKAGSDEIVRLCLDHGFEPAREYRDRIRRSGLIGDLALCRACERGAVELLNELLARGAIPIGNAEAGHVPLKCAVQARHAEIVQVLLDHGALSPLGNGRGFGMQRRGVGFLDTLVSLARVNRDLETLGVLLGFDPSFAELTTGSSQLHGAVEDDWLTGARALLDAGFDPEGVDLRGKVPLDCATSDLMRDLLHARVAQKHFMAGAWPRSQREAAARWAAVLFTSATDAGPLPESGLDQATARTTDDHGQTLVFYAIVAGRPDAIGVLHRSGADLDALANDGLTAVRLAVARGDLRCLEALWACGANLAYSRRGDRSALAEAILNRQPEIVSWLLDHGAHPGREAEHSFSSLSIAAQQGDRDLVQRLLSLGADPCAVDGNGWPVVLHAALSGNSDCVALLEAHGANLQHTLHSCADVLVVAVRNGDVATASRLLQIGVPQPSDIVAHAAGRPEMIAMLNEYAQRHGGAWAEEARFWANVAACSCDAVDRFLADRGNPNFLGDQTPLQQAVQAGRLDIVNVLITHEADPNLVAPADTRPPLMLALLTANLSNEGARAEMTRTLLAAGADPDFVPSGSSGTGELPGTTALMLGVRRGYPGAVRALLDAGADLSRCDSEGHTAFDCITAADNDAPAGAAETIRALLLDAQRRRFDRATEPRSDFQL